MSTARVRRPNTARLGCLSNGMLMTPEEFDAATDFDELYSYELIHGVLIVSPPPQGRRIKMRVSGRLGTCF